MANPIPIVLLASIFSHIMNIMADEFCNWAHFKAAVIRDQVFINGGDLWTTRNLEIDNPAVFTLNFSSPLNSTTNFTTLFTPIPYPFPGNLFPNAIGGMMFADNYQIYLFGGLTFYSNLSVANQNETVLGYKVYKSDQAETWLAGNFFIDTLPAGLTSYVTDGAGVNVPSESLGFYFSGMQDPSGGSINYDYIEATLTARSFIQIDMSNPSYTTWTNHSLPENVKGRANSQIVWIPVSTRGILVAIGGVVNPEDIFDGAPSSEQQQESLQISPSFMASIPIYDIASGNWYTQNTTAGKDGYPPQLSGFCSTVAIASDHSSFEIYIYDGYDGILATESPSDNVWVLSLPSFRWFLVYKGTASHGRSFHSCVQPYPNLMFTIGGVHVSYATCVEGIVQVFNLNELRFQDSYDPVQDKNEWEYQVPAVIYDVIGGGASGGSSLKANWSDPNIAMLFETLYAKEIPIWYPYNSTSLPPVTNPHGYPIPPKAPLPHPWLVLILAVVTATLALVMVVIGALFLLGRKPIEADYEPVSQEGELWGNPISRWITGLPNAAYLEIVPESKASTSSSTMVEDKAPKAEERLDCTVAAGSNFSIQNLAADRGDSHAD